MSQVTIKELLEAGVHFGHQTKRWNPKMEQFIFETRNGIHIIDLRRTYRMLNQALDFIKDRVARGEDVLFVGTKKQVRSIVKETTARLEMHYVIDRWLGGTLTNFQTIRSSIKRLEELEKMREEGSSEGRSKKEMAALRREENRLHRNLDGIRKMSGTPGILVVVDILREANAVREGRKLGVPIVAVVDTNCDPTLVDFPIPGNDDGIRSTKVIFAQLIEAIEEGVALRREKAPPEKKEAAKKTRAGSSGSAGKSRKKSVPVAKEKKTENKKETEKGKGKEPSPPPAVEVGKDDPAPRNDEKEEKNED